MPTWFRPRPRPRPLLLLLPLLWPNYAGGDHPGTADEGTVAVEALQLRSAVAKGRAFEQSVLLRLRGTDLPGEAEEQDLCVALDVSSSMEGRKLEVARHALSHIVRKMRQGDRLHVVTFHTLARLEIRNSTAGHEQKLLEALKALPSTASAARRAAVVARGPGAKGERSDLRAALELLGTWVAPPVGGAGRAAPRRLFILSDGLTSGGAAEYWEVLASVEQLQQQGVTTSAFAVGGDHEQRLMRAVAKVGRGSFLTLDGSAASIRRICDLAADRKAFFATSTTLWLTPEQGAERLRAFGHRRRSVTEPFGKGGARGDSFGISEMIPVGTIPHGWTEDVLVVVQLPAIYTSTPYLFYEMAYHTAEDIHASISGRVRVDVRHADAAAMACEESTDQEPLERFPMIAGAEWEATERWNCGMGYANISSHLQAPLGSDGSLAGRRWCATRCLSSPSCVAFSYPHPGDGRCWLKAGDAQMSSRLSSTCGGPATDWDYYTLLDRQPMCPKASCMNMHVSGANLVKTAPCRNSRGADEGSDANGLYTCNAGAYNGKNVYRLVEGLDADITWELRWESRTDWGATDLGKLAGLHGKPKWVLYGNGHYRYFVVSSADEPPRSGWQARNQANTDYDCATGSINVHQERARPAEFLETLGLCSGAAGSEMESGRRGRGYMSRVECENHCRAQLTCTAYQHDNRNMCFIHTSAQIAGGGGQEGVRCYAKAQATEFLPLSYRKRCANVFKVLDPAMILPEACAELAAYEPGCGHTFQVRRVAAFAPEAGCTCVAAGLRCEEVDDDDADVYEILKAFATNHGVELVRDLERLLEKEEEAQLDHRHERQTGSSTMSPRHSLYAEVDVLAARAKRLYKLDPKLAHSGFLEQVMDLDSRWNLETSACVGAPALCRAATTGSAAWSSRLQS